jgi:hypothetical protein
MPNDNFSIQSVSFIETYFKFVCFKLGKILNCFITVVLTTTSGIINHNISPTSRRCICIIRIISLTIQIKTKSCEINICITSTSITPTVLRSGVDVVLITLVDSLPRVLGSYDVLAFLYRANTISLKRIVPSVVVGIL